jgi:hypothetical protein
MNLLERSLLPAALVVGLSACAATPDHAPRAVSADTVAATTTQGDYQRTALTLADTISLCKEIQRDRGIPISCTITYMDGRPTMVAEFPNTEYVRTLIGPFARYVAGPFCEAANTGNREAFLVLAVRSPRLGAVYSCETGESSDWVPLDELLVS